MAPAVALNYTMGVASQHQRTLVWESLLHAEILHRYYGYLAELLEKRDKRLAWAALVSASGAAAVILFEIPGLYGKLLALLTTGLNLWLVLSRYGKQSLISANLSKKFGDLIVELDLLWGKVDELEDEQIQPKYTELHRRATAITEFAPVELKIDERLRERSFDETVKVRTAV